MVEGVVRAHIARFARLYEPTGEVAAQRSVGDRQCPNPPTPSPVPLLLDAIAQLERQPSRLIGIVDERRRSLFLDGERLFVGPCLPR